MDLGVAYFQRNHQNGHRILLSWETLSSLLPHVNLNLLIRGVANVFSPFWIPHPMVDVGFPQKQIDTLWQFNVAMENHHVQWENPL